MSQQQPGPYGVPPQPPQPPQQPPAAPYGSGPAQPNPYAAGPGLPPQQPPQGPYGYGYGQQQPFGPPQPPIPPRGGGKGKAVALAAGAVVLVAAIVGGAFVLVKGGGKDEPRAKGSGSPSASSASGSPSPSASADGGQTYKLTAPDTVAGTYKKDTSANGGGFGSKSLLELRMLGMSNPVSVTGSYVSGAEDKRTQKLLRFSGAYGDSVKSPEVLVDGMFKSMETAVAKETNPEDKPELEGTPQTMTPEGLEAGAVMKCQMTAWKTNAAIAKIRMPLCIWADKSTMGTVFALDASLISQGQDLGLDEAARRTMLLRKDVRVVNDGRSDVRSS
ncbi:hypothetical protein GCM10010218_16290 [Streptomyces mashuensis]|uniref:Uncharacterized protein n=1 Tax=Streptomyces mashuensis TaxID=33904 RepID=A0A919EBV8_9ACTN|nr:hypothetical protein [Streptomyces mashuensis]GHF35671.1 hypothetical protein GCM10010218_16290 [Streptomyces mashuensis]